MSGTRPAEILRQLEHTGAPDADLLARFAASRSAAAFAELVRRHGALVLGVCRRVTRHPQDAEDAFQATFLVLAQKADTLRNAALLGNWLYGVAYRVAWRARRAATRRRAREVTMSNPPDAPAAPAASVWSELVPVLDEELAALPAHYREAIVLCDLRGATREDAAVALGVPEGTLSSRLANGRKKLAARLTKRGITLSVPALALTLDEARAAVTVPNELVTQTCGLVAEVTSGGAVPRAVAYLLSRGSDVRKMLAIGVAMMAVAAGAVLAARPAPDAPPGDPPKPPVAVEQVTEQPKSNEAPKARSEKVVAYTTDPRLSHTMDLGINRPSDALWNSTGTHLAVCGRIERGNTLYPVVCVCEIGNLLARCALIPGTSQLVGASPDGKGFATARREHRLISGHHQFNFWEDNAMGVASDIGVVSQLSVHRTVRLDPNLPNGDPYVNNGVSYRAAVREDDGKSVGARVAVLEVDTASGKRGKTLLTVAAGSYALSGNGKRFATYDRGAEQVTVYDLDSGAKLSSAKLPGGDKATVLPVGWSAQLWFSPDGKRLGVSRFNRITILNADTGETVPALDLEKQTALIPESAHFTGDGRLLVAMYRSYVSMKPATPSEWRDIMTLTPRELLVTLPNDEYWIEKGSKLAVWDTSTGKVLKAWEGRKEVRATFCPTKPLLAILESNGSSGTRLGFWDFAAEVEKK